MPVVVTVLIALLALGAGYYTYQNSTAQASTATAAGAQSSSATEAKPAQEQAVMAGQATDGMKEKLTPEQYNICFLKGTEPPGSGKYYHFDEAGEYHCAVCGALLFKSDTKYDSGSGWPAFWETAEPGAVKLIEDRSLGMVRTEVECANCGAHLGHVFEDGPPPTGQRYCINSLALEFVAASSAGLSTDAATTSQPCTD